MKRWEVVVEPPAKSDMAEAYEWIAEREPDAADRWLAGIDETIGSLHRFPERCPLAPENRFFDCEIREVFYGRRQYKYRILFTCDGNTVHILHVRHGARLWLGETEND